MKLKVKDTSHPHSVSAHVQQDFKVALSFRGAVPPEPRAR